MSDLQQQILEIDARLLVAGERLKRYRTAGELLSTASQRGVCDRLLDERLVLMGTRDAQAARAER